MSQYYNLRTSDDGVEHSELLGLWTLSGILNNYKTNYLEFRTMDKVHKPSDSVSILYVFDKIRQRILLHSTQK
jgi:hypothetical protein